MRIRIALAAAALAAFLAAVVSASASTPAATAITVPTTVGVTVTDGGWSGTIPTSAGPANTCDVPEAFRDHHTVNVTVPAGAYSLVRAQFTFSIAWTPVVNINTSDEILTVYGPGGVELGSSDGGSPMEAVVLNNLPAGAYDVVACGFANAQPQPYTGQVEIKTFTPSASSSLPSAPAQGFAFGASVAADNQRDEAEPLMETDLDGNIYTCGPTGFSNNSDYAQVSTDGGDQFHMLGTPPRGQQGTGGGGDCGLASGVLRNASNNYQYAYSGLGPLTGFTTSTSADKGHTILNGGPQGAGLTSKGGGADRQWNVFVDSITVLISYNQQVPRNTVVQTSTDGGLTYSAVASIAAPNPTFPGPMRFNPAYTTGGANGLVFFGWDKTGGAGAGMDAINLSVSTDHGATWKVCRAATAAGDAAGFVTADYDSAGNIYLAYADGVDYHTYLVTLAASNISKCNQASTAQPTTNPGFSTPLQVDRDLVRTTVFPWLSANGAPGRVAVTFYGTESEGDPNTGTFKASWDVYVNQSLNALDPAARTFSQVKATTHPFHYDSVCLNGLGCDLAVPPGDRSLADFFALDYNPVTTKLSVVYDRGNKKPDEPVGHIASPMAATQIGGPSNGGGTVSSDANHAVLRTSAIDPTGDALASYSGLVVSPPAVNEPASDFVSASIGPELTLPGGTPVANGGFTVTMNVSDLSATALAQALADTGSQSLLWIWRFTNGYQDVAASARWSPVGGFTFGYNDYTVGSAPCEPGAPAASEKCILYPGGTAILGDVDQTTGRIRLSVPRSLLRALSGPTGNTQRPTEVAATVGSRFYDGTAFSLGNTISPVQTLQTFLYPLDNTPAMDFVLPGGSTAVAMRSLGATRNGQAVVVRWRTGSEVGNAGFNVYRSKAARRVKLNARIIPSKAGGAASGHAYAWRDRAPGAHPRYWIEELHLDGKRVLRGPVSPR